jgi:Xaa-Pro aminopeptidase
MKYLPLNAALFVKNRERFVNELLPSSIAVFVSNDEIPSNGDAIFPFKQNSDLYWLTGIEQEDSMVFRGIQIQNTGKCWYWFDPMS